MTRTGLGALLIAFSFSSAFAQAPRDSAHTLKATMDLGYLNASGNTSVSTLSSGENLNYKAHSIELIQSGSVVYGRTKDSTTTEQIKTGARINFLVAKFTGLFVGAGYERNRFAGLSRRFEEDAGIAFQVLNRPMDTWLVEIGASYNQEKSTLGVSRNFTSLRGATSVRHNFTKTTFLQEDLEVLPTTTDWNDTRVNSMTALAAPISVHVALKVSYQIKFRNVPEPGFKKSDRIFTTGVQITF